VKHVGLTNISNCGAVVGNSDVYSILE